MTYDRWWLVGEALLVDRAERVSLPGAPEGKGYTITFNRLLDANGFADIDGATRKA